MYVVPKIAQIVRAPDTLMNQIVAERLIMVKATMMEYVGIVTNIAVRRCVKRAMELETFIYQQINKKSWEKQLKQNQRVTIKWH